MDAYRELKGHFPKVYPGLSDPIFFRILLLFLRLWSLTADALRGISCIVDAAAVGVPDFTADKASVRYSVDSCPRYHCMISPWSKDGNVNIQIEILKVKLTQRKNDM